MSRKEHERAVVLARVVNEGLPLGESAELLGLSYRQSRRIARRFRDGGRAALVHRGVGRTSNRSRAPAQRAEVLQLVRAEFGGSVERGPGQRFGPPWRPSTWRRSSASGFRARRCTTGWWRTGSGVLRAGRDRNPGGGSARHASANSYRWMAASTTGTRAGASVLAA